MTQLNPTTNPIPESAVRAAEKDYRTDCGWRLASNEQTCVHCRKPTKGRNEYGTAAACFACYHNINQNCIACRCGEALRALDGEE